MISINELENHLIGLSHGGTLNKVRNRYYLYKRVANTLLSKIKPLESIRVSPLIVSTDNFDYSLPSDFDGLIGIYPQGSRNWDEEGEINTVEDFDRLKKIDDKKFSIEGLNGVKKIRIDWDTRPAKVLHAMESYDGNGTWIASGTTTNILTDTIYKAAGGGAVRFDVGASGDGISNTSMASVDLTTEDERCHNYILARSGTVCKCRWYCFPRRLESGEVPVVYSHRNRNREPRYCRFSKGHIYHHWDTKRCACG